MQSTVSRVEQAMSSMQNEAAASLGSLSQEKGEALKSVLEAEAAGRRQAEAASEQAGEVMKKAGEETHQAMEVAMQNNEMLRQAVDSLRADEKDTTEKIKDHLFLPQLSASDKNAAIDKHMVDVKTRINNAAIR